VLWKFLRYPFVTFIRNNSKGVVPSNMKGNMPAFEYHCTVCDSTVTINHSSIEPVDIMCARCSHKLHRDEPFSLKLQVFANEVKEFLNKA